MLIYILFAFLRSNKVAAAQMKLVREPIANIKKRPSKAFHFFTSPMLPLSLLCAMFLGIAARSPHVPLVQARKQPPMNAREASILEAREAIECAS
jgi:hypothetical protein